jgi:hypothetical protein
MKEQWRKIDGWKGDFYEVSDRGRVRSKDRYVAAGKGGAGLALRRGKVLQPVCKQGRYLAVTLAGDGKRQQYLIHDLVADTFLGPKPPGQCVRHLDDRKSNNRASNLTYGTHRENEDDAMANGRKAKGSKHGCAKLTERDVRAIRVAKARGVDLAKEYDVSPGHISSIRNRKTWKHLDA